MTDFIYATDISKLLTNHQLLSNTISIKNLYEIIIHRIIYLEDLIDRTIQLKNLLKRQKSLYLGISASEFIKIYPPMQKHMNVLKKIKEDKYWKSSSIFYINIKIQQYINKQNKYKRMNINLTALHIFSLLRNELCRADTNRLRPQCMILAFRNLWNNISSYLITPEFKKIIKRNYPDINTICHRFKIIKNKNNLFTRDIEILE